ncbi:DUF4192 domain-containing protein [Streptomyces sp. NPDC046831]|uniref:DUF4192 domain-containing protein n=1 Tax=Streptomyces sp. NPDC046831 TaxID=3154805 RepID=UPI003400D2E1
MRAECFTYDGHGAEHQVTLRTPAELADALPYLLGYRPEDSVVLVALHDQGGRGRFGGRARLGIPTSVDDWPSAARQLAHGLITGSERKGAKPGQMVAFLCQEPAAGESGRQVMRRLEPLAHKLRLECGRLDVPVIEALCISDGRFWSYCCPTDSCCPEDGLPMGLPGTSVLAAAAAYAGIQVRGSLSELRARLLPRETFAAREQEIALDAAGLALVPRILDDASRAEVAEETLCLAEGVMRRFAEAPGVAGIAPADLRDDALLSCEEAAALILGLQDRTTRDRAAEWMEGDEAGAALRLWRALARRCVGPYGEHAAAPLTLAGWVAWSTGDGIEAREALAMALGADPHYLFARLLHQACNEGLDPESVRRCLRAEREARTRRTAGRDADGGMGADGPEPGEGGTPVPGGAGCPASGEDRTAANEGPGGPSEARAEAPAGGKSAGMTHRAAAAPASVNAECGDGGDGGEAGGRRDATGRDSTAQVPGLSSLPRRRRRTRLNRPGPGLPCQDGQRPATARSDGAHPGGPRTAPVRPRALAEDGVRRRDAVRPQGDTGDDATEGAGGRS